MINNSNLLFTVTFIVIFLVLLCLVIIVFVIKSRAKIFSKELEKKDLKIKYQSETLRKIIEAQENERLRIARDLHDEISSKLIAVSLNLYLLKSKKTKEEDKEQITQDIFHITDKTIESSRKIAHHLYPPVLEKFGIIEALKELVLDYNKSTKVAISLSFDCYFKSEVNNQQLQVFRVIQELINNSIRHGKAKKINISFKAKDLQIECQYSDNGVGFDISDIDKHKGLGFHNIENRIQNINGTFKISSALNQGFNFTFKF